MKPDRSQPPHVPAVVAGDSSVGAAPGGLLPATSDATLPTGAAPANAVGAEIAEHEALPDLLDENGPERHYVMRALLLVGAVLCLVAGIIGWLIPVMPGFPFYILGAVMAGMASRRAARFLNRQERRLPQRVRLLLRPKLRRARRDEDRAARGE